MLVYDLYGRTSNTGARITRPIAVGLQTIWANRDAILAETGQDGMTPRGWKPSGSSTYSRPRSVSKERPSIPASYREAGRCGKGDSMPRICPVRGSSLRVAIGILAGLVLSAACSSPSVVLLTPGQAATREVLIVGDLVDVVLDDPNGVDTWTTRTSSEQDVVVIRFSGNPALLGVLRIRVLLPGGVLVADLSPPADGQFAVALSGRAATWTLELSLAERASTPASFRMDVVRPTASTATGGVCADALRARGITAWVMSAAAPPGAGGLPFSGLGSVALTATPAPSLAAVRQTNGAAPVLHVSGTSLLRGDFAGLGCAPNRVQITVWDAGRGKPPVMSIADASARRLCGGTGQPACPTNPTPRRWVSWTLSSSEPIRSLSLEADDLYLSSLVIQ